ncbi:MAG TPA: hypothetical protein VFQ61_34165, partial [Polyangiaceae bacterium]|nr:hypothetical protein [Polyangiaceae bacterium]
KYSKGTLTDLGYYLGDSRAEALAANDGGSVIVGWSGAEGSTTSTKNAVTWTGAGTKVLPKLAGAVLCSATDVSKDGSVIVGECDGIPVRWKAGVVESLPAPEGLFALETLVSGNGTTVVSTLSKYPYIRPAVWDEAQRAFEVVPNFANYTQCVLKALTHDGEAGVGTCASASVGTAVRWSSGLGLTGLPSCREDVSVYQSYDISGDGSVIVGDCVWSGNEAIPNILTRLPSSVTGDDAYSSSTTRHVSADGKRLVISMMNAKFDTDWALVRLD